MLCVDDEVDGCTRISPVSVFIIEYVSYHTIFNTVMIEAAKQHRQPCRRLTFLA